MREVLILLLLMAVNRRYGDKVICDAGRVVAGMFVQYMIKKNITRRLGGVSTTVNLNAKIRPRSDKINK